MSDAHRIVANVAVWLAWSVLAGYVGHRWPRRAFEHDSWWSRLRPFEHHRRFYTRVIAIHAWKDRLPELGGLFPDGFAKRSVARSPDRLARFLAETRRAEAVHWVVFWLWPVFALWNPPWAVAVMLIYATAANVPCLLVQRYNRARLMAALLRRARLDALRSRSAGVSPSSAPRSTAPALRRRRPTVVH